MNKITEVLNGIFFLLDLRNSDRRWSSKLEVGRGANNPSQ